MLALFSKLISIGILVISKDPSSSIFGFSSYPSSKRKKTTRYKGTSPNSQRLCSMDEVVMKDNFVIRNEGASKRPSTTSIEIHINDGKDWFGPSSFMIQFQPFLTILKCFVFSSCFLAFLLSPLIFLLAQYWSIVNIWTQPRLYYK